MALNLASVSGAPIDGPADCTLACDEGHLTAHKIILCAHSRYLQDILSKFPNAEHPIIILTELNITDIKILVNYMYTGELVITNDGSPTSLLRAAQILKIDSLTDFDDDDDDVDDDDREAEDQEEKADDNNIVLPLVNGIGRSGARQQHTNNNNNNNNYNDSNRNHNNNNIQQQHVKMEPEDDDDHMLDEDEDENEENLSIGTGADVDHLHHSHNHHLHHNHHHHARAEANNNNNTSNNKIRCHLCNIGLSDVKCLYRHVLTRHLPEKWGYKCEFCDREFSRDDHLMRHYTTKHKNMEFNREKIRETRRLNREMAKNFHDQISTIL